MISVEPLTRAWGEALSLGEKSFSERFGIPVVEGWAVFPEALPGVLGSAPENGDRWGTHLFFDDDGALFGWGGWKGPPVDGAVELGYAVAPARRGRGLATKVVQLMLSEAGEALVDLVIAHTLPEESASTGVLRNCGFSLIGEVADPDDESADVVWRWETHPARLT